MSHRYYYPEEPYNSRATEVNHLVESEITRKRGKDCTYPEYFRFDPEFVEFCAGIPLIVCHNATFDVTRLPFLCDRMTFCTMKTNTNIMQLPFKGNRRGNKAPKLEEACEYYGVENQEAHDALGDVLATKEILEKMMDNAGYVFKIKKQKNVLTEEDQKKLREAIEW